MRHMTKPPYHSQSCISFVKMRFGDGRHLVKILTIIFYLICRIQCNDILGCGGFIKSHADIDFSRVEIKLLTKQGSLKDKTDCSPSNGYYFLPLYDKGEYVLKIAPPAGWSFENEQFEINFDGKTDLCSLGKDVNFEFKGFGITGFIAVSGQKNGAKDVNVELRAVDGSDIRRTVSDATGVFSFTPVIPGKYAISVSRDSWHFTKSVHDVVVQTGNTELPENTFVVAGFDVRGRIAVDDQVQHSIQFVLFSKKNGHKPTKCQSANLPKITSQHPDYESAPACVVNPSKAGDFLFEGIASGKYLVRPYIGNENVQLHLKTEYIQFEVLKDALVLSEEFTITGFNAVGRVLTAPNGFGVANAKILINGEQVTVTHTDGTYSLKNIKADTYTVQAVADDVQFTDRIVKISIANPTVPDIVVSAFKVCGDVISQRSFTVAITKHSSTFHTQAVSKAGTGQWCTYLPTGRFTVEVLTSADDKAQGIQFFPLQQNIEVSASPVSGIMFSQLRATVVGEVKCLSDASRDCKEISITLNALDANGARSGQFSTATLNGGKYSFNNVLPGSYEVTVASSSLCWEANTLTINVKTASETIPTLVHNGYLVSVSSSHNTRLSYKHRSEPQSAAAKEILLAPGPNTFCVEKFGQYDIVVSGCHTYDNSALRSSFSTGETAPIVINAIKHKSGLRILSDVRNAFQIAVDQNGQRTTYALTEEREKVNGQFAYRFDFDLRPDERILVTPESDVMLFGPASKELVGTQDCVETAFTFVAAKGLIINGKVNPPIAGAKISLSFPQNSELQNLEALTTANGAFKFGPLNGNLEVHLTAFKESYVFSDYDTTRNEFKAHKLCEIIATVKDERGNLLPGVLLSLSGAESYRKNLITAEDGRINFHSLSPSQYFLRPMMKEYRFEPASKIIDVKDGETIDVELNGKRVAFSVFGAITSLNGDAFENVVVEARADEPCAQHQEEATTELNGQYRIRGLQPGCKYTVQVRSGTEGEAVVERTIPDSKTVSVEHDDITDINIIAISPISYVDVMARITASTNDYYKSLRVTLYKKGNSDSPIYSQRVESPLNVKGRVNPGIMVFFPRIPYDQKTYVIELSTTLSDRNFKYTLPLQAFEANRSTIYVELDFTPEIRLNEADFNQNSISALVLIALVVIAFFKQELAIEFLSLLWSKLSVLVDAAINQATKRKDLRHDTTYNESEIEKLAQSINATKKNKSRKT